MRLSSLPRIAAAALLALVSASSAVAETDAPRYGYYRVVEGSANLHQDGSTLGLQENHPLVTGDRLWTGGGSRVEVELPDGTLVRLGGGAELSFDELAGSGDTSGDGTLLYLQEGELQVVTETTFGVEAYPRIDTPNASVYLEGAGSYRIETRGDQTRVAVRSGAAEVRTRRGGERLGPDDEAWIEGGDYPGLEVRAAAGPSALERWGGALEDEVRQASVDRSLDRRLHYGASRLDSYGSWVDVDSRRAWRPRVAADWSPYRHGRWVYTPSGLTWASYEPWGWVPYHYGSWDYTPGWGWVWYPGAVYAPAWVYWYWGPSYVGWAPVGYYYRHYWPSYYRHVGWDYGYGFRFGIHGWAGGRLSHWDRWNFVDCRRLGDHRLAVHTRSAAQLGDGLRELPRGIIATDTRELRHAIATRPAAAMRHLAEGRGAGAELPDVTRFIARDPDLPRDVARAALPVDPQGGDGGRVAVPAGWAKPARAAGDSARGSVPGDFAAARPRDAAGSGAAAATRGAVSRTRPGQVTGGAPGQARTPATEARTAPPAQRGIESKPVARPSRPGEWSPPESPARTPSTPGARSRPPATRGAVAPATPEGGRAPVARSRVGAPAGSNDGSGSAWRSAPPAHTAPPPSRPDGAPRSLPPAGDDGSSGARRRAVPPSEGSGGRTYEAGRAPRIYEAPAARREVPPQTGVQRSLPPVRRVVEGVRRPDAPPQAPAISGRTAPSPSRPSAPYASSPSGATRREAPPPSSYQGGGPSRSSGDSATNRGQSSSDRGSSDRGSRSSDGGAARTRSRSSDPDRH